MPLWFRAFASRKPNENTRFSVKQRVIVRVVYNRKLMDNPSYHRKTPLVITEEMRREIAGAVAEIDLAQMEILRRMTPAQRMAIAAAMIADLERAAAHQLRKRHPELDTAESLRIVRRGVLKYEQQRLRNEAHVNS